MRVPSGTYQINEDRNAGGQCSNTNYGGGVAFIDNSELPLPRTASFCIFLEGNCSGTIQSGEEKTCTVKNYFVIGSFSAPQAGIAVNGATTEGTTSQASNNALTSQSNNVITNPTTTQSSNAGGVPQSSNIVPSTFSSSTSSTLVNITPE